MSPEASDLAWIFVVNSPRERPSACPCCPLLLRLPTHGHARWSSRTSGRDERYRSSTRACRSRLRRRRPCSTGQSGFTRCYKDRSARARRQRTFSTLRNGALRGRAGRPPPCVRAVEGRRGTPPVCASNPVPLFASTSTSSPETPGTVRIRLGAPREPHNRSWPKFVHTAWIEN